MILLFPVTCFLYPAFAHSEVSIVVMVEGGFEPQTLTLDQNSTVLFFNKDKVDRWPASNIHPTHDLYPEFDPRKPINPSESWSFKPKEVGEWKYHDHLYPHMRGAIIVRGEKSEVGYEIEKNKSSSPALIWEESLKKVQNMIGQFISQLKSLFKFDKTISLPDPSKFKNLSLREQSKNLEDLDPQKAWEFIQTTFAGEGGSAGNVHDLAHLVGSLIYQKKGFSGISICSPQFAFGCYHGFLDTAFAKDLDHLSEAHDACKKLDSGNNLTGSVASCIHGIGHGVASFYQTADLVGALSTCRKLPTGEDYCYDGILMEFVRSAPDSFFKKNDPLYPCNQLEREFGYVYSQACGRNQPPLLMSRFKMGFDEVIGVCRSSSSKPFQQACFDALGFSLASGGDVNQIISGCRKIAVIEYIAECIKSAAGELIFQEIPGWENKWQEVCAASQQANNCLENGQRLIKDYGRVVRSSFDDYKEDDDHIYI